MKFRTPYLGIYGRRLFLVLALLSLVLTSALGLLGYFSAQKTITSKAEIRLFGIAKERSEKIRMWFEEQDKIILTLTELRQFRQIVADLCLNRGEGSSNLKDLREIIKTHKAIYNVSLGYEIRNLNGRVVFAYYPDPSDSTSDFSSMDFPRALETEVPTWSKIHLLKPGIAVLDLMKTVKSPGGEVVGVFIIKVDPKTTLNKILSSTEGLELTGETYLIGSDTTMLTPSRHEDHPYPLTHKMPTTGALHCLAGKDSMEVYEGFDGEKLLGAYIWMPEQEWALMAEMHLAEAFAPLYRTSYHFILITGGGLILVLSISILISRQLTHPLSALAEASKRIAQGDFTTVNQKSRGDEIADLTEHFNRMVISLQKSREQLQATLLKLAQSQNLAVIGQLVAGIVHEMQNPLSTIKMNLRILEKKGNLDEDKLEHLKLAKEQTIRLEVMLNELLEYSKPVKPKLTSVELNALLKTVMANKAKVLEEKGMVGKLKLPDDAITVNSDGDLLTRILDNLICNAVNASHSGQAITLNLSQEDTTVNIAVEDNGIGMSKEVQGRLFEPFFTTRKSGIGLGLNNVRKFVEALEGEIKIESQENVGTRVRIRLKR
jgi:signal transduction histidine kinase